MAHINEKPSKITSYTLKNILLSYLRFERQLIYVSTESGSYNSDILASDGKFSYEIETKIDKYDLRADMMKKKHQIYKNLEPCKYRGRVVPNYFFFAVTEELKDLALDIGYELNPRYGVIVVKPNSENYRYEVVRSARRLHNNPILATELGSIIRRMSSQLCNLVNLKEEITQSFGAYLEKLEEKALMRSDKREEKIISDGEPLVEEDTLKVQN